MLKDNELSRAKRDELNPLWKGNQVGYNALHLWVRQRYHKPELCEHCTTRPSIDLANKSGLYIRDLTDWWYLCRKCHMDMDGRNQQLRESGQSRKIEIPSCFHCGVEFYRKSGQRVAKFCSRRCFFAAGGRYYKGKGGPSQ